MQSRYIDKSKIKQTCSGFTDNFLTYDQCISYANYREKYFPKSADVHASAIWQRTTYGTTIMPTNRSSAVADFTYLECVIVEKGTFDNEINDILKEASMKIFEV